MALIPELERIREETEEISTRAKELCYGLAEKQLAWRPNPSSWCIAEILLHLDNTTRIFLPIIDRAIVDSRRNGRLSNGPFRLSWMGKFYVWYAGPPARIRLSAPKPLVPLLKGPASSALPQFLQSQELMKQRLNDANGIDVERTRITSPFANFVRMSLFALFSVFTAHERRHIWQLSNVRAQLPPRSSP
jgi:hypothetical protein